MEQPDEDDLRGQVEAMRVKQIKAELDKLGVAHDDAFEKEDLVQRLLDAKNGPQGEAPSFDQVATGIDMVMADEDGAKIMEAVQQNERLMQAAMDIAMNGFSDKYADDEEVMEFMQRLEAVSKRQA